MSEKKKSSINKINIVISILISIAAWVFVVYNYMPMKKVTYYDLPIKYVGQDVLKYRGLELKQKTSKLVDVTLNVRRTEIRNINAKDIEVEADLSEAERGYNSIMLEITSPSGSLLSNSNIKKVSAKVDWIGTK